MMSKEKSNNVVSDSLNQYDWSEMLIRLSFKLFLKVFIVLQPLILCDKEFHWREVDIVKDEE